MGAREFCQLPRQKKIVPQNRERIFLTLAGQLNPSDFLGQNIRKNQLMR